MQDLKDVTREIHYENYRAQCIQNMTRMMVQERKRRWAESAGKRFCFNRDGCLHTTAFIYLFFLISLYLCLFCFLCGQIAFV